jgi:hypothetical protein
MNRRGRGRRTWTGKGFSMLIHDYFRSQEYAQLSPRAVKALVDLYTQFRGGNNGDLCATFSIMNRLGWRSKDQLAKALSELEERGWILRTRQGGFMKGRHLATLYAVSWLGIDSCNGKLDVRPNPVPAHSWKRASAKISVLPRHTGQSAPPHGSVPDPQNSLLTRHTGPCTPILDIRLTRHTGNFLDLCHRHSPELDRWADDGGLAYG